MAVDRRIFLAGSAALASAPALGAVAASGETDVAIIGAGAAGIAAARKVAAAGRRFALIEASDRVGGRCFTESRSFGVPYDRGAHWLHMPDLNPLAKLIATTETGLDLQQVNPLEDIAKISPRPVYIVHGTGDTVAPPDAGRKLYEAANEPRFLWEAENIQHMLIYLDNPRKYQRRLLGFFDEWLLAKQ